MSRLTRDQLAWIEEQVHRAADKAAKRTRNRALVGFLILLLGIGFTLRDSAHKADEARNAITDSGTVIAVDGCNRDFNSRVELRELLQSSLKITRNQHNRGLIKDIQYETAAKF